MELKVNADKKIEDGKHEGEIVAVEYRTEPFEYTDIVINMDGLKIKAGYPTFIAPNSKLGQCLQRLGVVLVIDEQIDLEQVLIGKKVSFLTMTNHKTGYSDIVGNSLKLAEAQPKTIK